MEGNKPEETSKTVIVGNWEIQIQQSIDGSLEIIASYPQGVNSNMNTDCLLKIRQLSSTAVNNNNLNLISGLKRPVSDVTLDHQEDESNQPKTKRQKIKSNSSSGSVFRSSGQLTKPAGPIKPVTWCSRTAFRNPTTYLVVLSRSFTFGLELYVNNGNAKSIRVVGFGNKRFRIAFHILLCSRFLGAKNSVFGLVCFRVPFRKLTKALDIRTISTRPLTTLALNYFYLTKVFFGLVVQSLPEVSKTVLSCEDVLTEKFEILAQFLRISSLMGHVEQVKVICEYFLSKIQQNSNFTISDLWCHSPRDEDYTSLDMCLYSGQLEILKTFHTSGGSLIHTNIDAPFMGRCLFLGHESFLEYILSNYMIDVNTTTFGSWNPLKWAVENKWTRVVRLILDRMKLTNQEKGEALHHAVHYQSKNLVEIRQLLIDLWSRRNSSLE